MALTLRAAINASQTTIDVLGSDDISEGAIYSVGSEYILVSTIVSPQRPYLDPLHRLLTVYRGVQGTPKAAHAAAAALTAVLPGAGGGVTVDNGVDAPAAVTTLVVSGAQASGDTADVFPGLVYDSGWIISGESGPGLATGGSVALNNSGSTGGGASVTGGDGDTGDYAGDANLIGGSGDGATPGHGGAQVLAKGGTPTDPGVLQIFTNGEGGSGGQFLGSDDNGGVVFRNPAAHVANGSTVDQLRDALIAAGLMAAS